MRIDALNMTHFGCFHQKELSFSPGINVIYGANETGKSTLHQFIQAMLFGVERLRGRAAKSDDYARFQPWGQGRSYEGTMRIQHMGEEYRLVRNFYKEDEYFRVEQLRTGKELTLSGQRIDALIHGLTRSSFKNTLSIRQMESQIDARFGLTLQTRMANIQQTKNQEIDLQETLDYLRKEKKAYMDNDPQRHLQELQTRIETLRVSEEERSRLMGDIRQQKEELTRMRREQQSELREDAERRRRDRKERMEAIRLIEENNYVAQQYQRKKAEYEELKRHADEEDFDELKREWDEANEVYDDFSDRYGQLMGRNLAILFSMMMFGLIPVVGVFFLKNDMISRLAAVAVFAVILIVTAVLLQIGRKRLGEKFIDSKRHLDELHDEMEAHMFGNANKETLRRMKSEIQALRERYEQLQIPLQPYIEKYGEDISLEDDDGDIFQTNFREKEVAQTKALERLFVQKETMDKKDAEREVLENEAEQIAAEIGDGQEQVGILDECIEIIQSLSEEIHDDFGPALNQEISRMMWELTDGKYNRITVDNELNLNVDTGTGFVRADQLSTGTREQLYLALRLAMVKLLFPEKNVPVMFDDSFVFYDDRRLMRTLAWIAAQNFEQILIFTCQQREIEALEQLGVSYNLIRL